jgi:RND family efflux transporter MFP subunit
VTINFDKPEHIEHDPTAHMPGVQLPPPKPISPLRFLLVVCVFAIVVAAVIYTGIMPRIRAKAALKQETEELAAPTVVVIHPQHGTPAQEVVLPGTTEAYSIAPIYARSSGYLKKWYFDIGAQVKTGVLLAEIESPEVDQQLLQARADVATAEANLKLAQINTKRYVQLQQEGVVAKQVADNTISDEEAKTAIVKSVQANVKRLEQMQSFQKIYAPFNGVITARRIDVGQLVDAGSNGGSARELFTLSDTKKLRVFVSVPQVFAHEAVAGVSAELKFADQPGRIFPGRLIRSTNVIDTVNRTLRVEVDVDNPKGEMMPGAFTEVHLKIAGGVPSLLLPVSAVMFRSEGLRIATVVDGNKAKLFPITIGRDLGNQVEIIGGLPEDARVIDSPPDSILDGMVLRVIEKKTAATQPSAPQNQAPKK